MSLTSLLSNDTLLKSVLKEIRPSINSFTSNIDFPAFSKNAPEIVPYQLTNVSDAAIVGTAADYFFRFIIARKIKNNKESSIENLVAEKGLNHLFIFKEYLAIAVNAQNEFVTGIRTVRKFIYGEDISLEKLATITLRFAYLDQFFRSSFLPKRPEDLLDRNDELMINALVELGKSFIKCFIETNIIKIDSDVIFNPNFGKWSMKCSGADADVYIDGTLYDFKCTKKILRDWTEIGQIYGYYCLYRLCKADSDIEMNLWQEKQIEKIAIYKARYGMINVCEISKSDANFSEDAIQRVKEAIEAENEKIDITMANLLEKQFEQTKIRSQISTITTTKLEKRNIPLESLRNAKGLRVHLGTVLGLGRIESYCNENDGANIVFNKEKSGKCQYRLIDFFCLHPFAIVEHGSLEEGKTVLLPQEGIGKVVRIEKNESYSEALIEVEKKGYKRDILINPDRSEWYIVHKLIPQISKDGFPYKEGERAILGSSVVKIKKIINENGKYFVILECQDGETKKLSMNIAAIHLSEEKTREDIKLQKASSGESIVIDNNIPIGEKVVLTINNSTEKAEVLEGIVESKDKKETGEIIVTIDFNKDGKKMLVGRRYFF